MTATLTTTDVDNDHCPACGAQLAEVPRMRAIVAAIEQSAELVADACKAYVTELEARVAALERERDQYLKSSVDYGNDAERYRASAIIAEARVAALEEAAVIGYPGLESGEPTKAWLCRFCGEWGFSEGPKSVKHADSCAMGKAKTLG